MDVHQNARLTPRGREDMARAVVDDGLTPAEAARRFNTTPKTAMKWVDRFRASIDVIDGGPQRPLWPHRQRLRLDFATHPLTCIADCRSIRMKADFGDFVSRSIDNAAKLIALYQDWSTPVFGPSHQRPRGSIKRQKTRWLSQTMNSPQQ